MADTSYSHANDLHGGVSHNGVNKAPLPASNQRKSAQDPGKTLLVGLLGGLASAVAFTVYQRLPDEQRNRVHDYVRSMIASRLSEFRDGLDL